MPVTELELDAMQTAYKSAVDGWVTAIREEEALATVHHSVAEIDRWEAAADRQEELREQVLAAKKAYEDALRERFFNF